MSEDIPSSSTPSLPKPSSNRSDGLHISPFLTILDTVTPQIGQKNGVTVQISAPSYPFVPDTHTLPCDSSQGLPAPLPIISTSAFWIFSAPKSIVPVSEVTFTKGTHLHHKVDIQMLQIRKKTLPLHPLLSLAMSHIPRDKQKNITDRFGSSAGQSNSLLSCGSWVRIPTESRNKNRKSLITKDFRFSLLHFWRVFGEIGIVVLHP